jgi:hypothetical protein
MPEQFDDKLANSRGNLDRITVLAGNLEAAVQFHRHGNGGSGMGGTVDFFGGWKPIHEAVSSKFFGGISHLNSPVCYLSICT